MAKDLFSAQSASYAKYRPTYPAELYEYILTFVKKREKAWDCATGNGQAALALAPNFEKVYATDISPQQIRNAVPNPKVEYLVAPCDHTPFPNDVFDLITVAQAYHWFDFSAFAKEVRRVARPGAVLAVWGYHLGICEDVAVQDLLEDFYRNTVGPFWDPERDYVDKYYETIPFPFSELSRRRFTIPVSWSQKELSGYLNTWSSVQHYLRDRGSNPVDHFRERLAPLWKGQGELQFKIPVFLLLGQVR